MREPISEEQINTAIRLYKRKDLTLNEIANLVDLSTGSLTKIYRSAFRENKLKPRYPDFALKPRVPNGQGTSKYIPTGIGKGGRNHEKKKFTDAEEEQVAKDYYENGYTMVAIQEKYGFIHPMQMQRIRNRFASVYGKKRTKPMKEPKPPKEIIRPRKPILQFDLNGNFICEYENCLKAGLATNIEYSNIRKCALGQFKTMGGFVWKYKESEI